METQMYSETHCKMTIVSATMPDDSDVVERFPIKHLPENSEARIGFERGTLRKATFEFVHGATLIYEAIKES